MNTSDYLDAEKLVCQAYKEFIKDVLGTNKEKTPYPLQDSFKIQARNLFHKFYDIGYKYGSNHKDVDDILEGKA